MGTEKENEQHPSEHDEEEKLEILPEPCATADGKESDDDNCNEKEIVIITDKLCCLRKSLILKEKENEQSVPMTVESKKSIIANPAEPEMEYTTVEFISQQHKDAYFDPLMS